MNIWRIYRAKHEKTAFSGAGAEKTGGRWNPKGFSIVYASENLSLATLELFVHVEPSNVPSDLVSIKGKLPGGVSTEEIDQSKLPDDWRRFPAPPELQSIGLKWLEGKSSLILLVPSAVNPVERNVLLSPHHPEFSDLEVESGQPFSFDPRMF